MKILIFIEHDAVIRHFIDSNAFQGLVRNHDVKFVFPEPGYKRVKTDVGALELGAPYRHLKVNQDRLHLWKQLFLLNQLTWRPGKQFAALRRLYRYAVGKKDVLKFSVLTLPGIRRLAENYYKAKINRTPYVELDLLLVEEEADVIIHPCVLEGVYINDLTLVCNERAIPFVVIMNSWDNPSTKQAMAGKPERLLVWGDQTRNHAIEFMNLPESSIDIFGVAQFDVHREPARIGRDGFCRMNDIPRDARILLYAGSSKGTDEYSHLRLLDEAVESGALGHTAVLYRPQPWGGCGRQGERSPNGTWKHVYIESAMRPYVEAVRAGSAQSIFPDYRDTRDVLANVDAVISPLSTIIIEAAIHRKPSLCFLAEGEANATALQLNLPLTHFEDLYEVPEFFVCRDYLGLVDAVVKLIDKVGDEDFADRLVRAAAHFAKPFEKPYSERLLAYTENLFTVRAS